MLFEKRNIASQLLLNRHTNQMKRKTPTTGGFMKAPRSRRMRLKSKRGPGKRHKTPRPVMADGDDINQLEPTHSLLLSSLNFWEIERDLIEERIAAMAR
jgi:hypothetical protein